MSHLPVRPERALDCHWSLTAKHYGDDHVVVTLSRLDLRTRKITSEDLVHYKDDGSPESSVRLALLRAAQILHGSLYPPPGS